MKKIWIAAGSILMTLPAVYPVCCLAQVTPVQKATPVIINQATRPKPDLSKLKPGPAPVKPKQKDPVNLQVKGNNIYRPSLQHQGSAPLQPVKGGNKMHGPVHHLVKDSSHRGMILNPGFISPASSKQKKGSRNSINQQPLPPKSGSGAHGRTPHGMTDK